MSVETSLFLCHRELLSVTGRSGLDVSFASFCVCVWLLEIQPWPGRQEAGVGPAVSSERGSEEDSGPRGARGKLRFSALGSPGLRCQESRTQTQGLALSQAPPSSGPFPGLLQHCFLSYV